MKSVLITAGVILGLCFFMLTSYATLGRKAISEVTIQEIGHDAMVDLADKDEKAFMTKYRPLLERRWLFAHIGIFLDDQFFLEVSKQTLEFYDETPLDKDPIFATFIFERAKALIDQGGLAQREEAFHLYSRYVTEFPDQPKYALANNAMTELVIKYGMH
jgi:hypothetical protein